ncbi:MAG: DUF1588 domain-containing protein [Myxococcales bacterium]|nr:DUF1588 domain-containing protein [Myxococcales bacterium]
MRPYVVGLAGLVGLLAGCVGRIESPGSGPAQEPPTTTTPSTPVAPADPRACADDTLSPTPRLRRLAFAEYDRSVRDLLTLDVSPSTELGPEVAGVTPTLWSGVKVAASQVAARFAADGAAFARVVGCGATPDADACAADFMTRFGRRAYRRPLTTEESERYAALWAARAELTETGSFEEGIALLVEAMLQSPGFLLRVERGAAVDGVVALDGYERATRVAYALWGAGPDDALLDAAAAGELDTAAGVRQQALRMVGPEFDPRVAAMLQWVHAEWLGMGGAYAQFWSNTQRDPALFPEFYPGIDAEFREEVLRSIESVFLSDGGFQALFTGAETQVTPALASIYGVAHPTGAGWAPVTLDPALRPGILSRAGFLGTHGRYTRGSLIYRGAFVQKRVLCRAIGAPPAGADATPLPESTENLRTTRQRIEAMTAAPSCAQCHKELINPAGFPLEFFDGIGRHRTTDNGEAVDGSATLVLDGKEITVDSPKAYAEALGSSFEAPRCYVDRFIEYTFADGAARLGCEDVRLADYLADPQHSLRGFLVELVSSPRFLTRAAEEAQ